MTAIALRILIFVLIAGAVFLGVRRIWRDWKGQFKAEDRARLDRDRQDRASQDVVTLKRDKDGKFRPPEE